MFHFSILSYHNMFFNFGVFVFFTKFFSIGTETLKFLKFVY